jgi:hypothetical protein
MIRRLGRHPGPLDKGRVASEDGTVGKALENTREGCNSEEVGALGAGHERRCPNARGCGDRHP